MPPSGPLPTEIGDAAALGNDEEVASWLDGGGHIDAEEDLDHTTLLINASFHGRESLVRMLLSRGAYIDAEDASGITALMGAASDGHHGTVRLLLRANARTDLKSGNNWTALQWAEHYNHADVAELLRNPAAAFIDPPPPPAPDPAADSSGVQVRVQLATEYDAGAAPAAMDPMEMEEEHVYPPPSKTQPTDADDLVDSSCAVNEEEDCAALPSAEAPATGDAAEGGAAEGDAADAQPLADSAEAGDPHFATLLEATADAPAVALGDEAEGAALPEATPTDADGLVDESLQEDDSCNAADGLAQLAVDDGGDEAAAEGGGGEQLDAQGGAADDPAEGDRQRAELGSSQLGSQVTFDLPQGAEPEEAQLLEVDPQPEALQ